MWKFFFLFTPRYKYNKYNNVYKSKVHTYTHTHCWQKDKNMFLSQGYLKGDSIGIACVSVFIGKKKEMLIASKEMSKTKVNTV